MENQNIINEEKGNDVNYVLAVGFLFLSDEEKNTLQNAIEKYGDRAQIIKAIE